jgi:hypothetical protein
VEVTVATRLLDRAFMLRIRRVIPALGKLRALSKNFGGLQALAGDKDDQS